MGGSWDATNVADADGRGGAADRGRPRAVPRRHAGRDRRREGRDHQARRDRGARRAAARGRRGAAARAPPRSARPSSARAWSSASSRGCPAVGGQVRLAAGPARRGTTRSSCRCTAPTRRRTPPSRWPRSRRSLGDERAARRRAGPRGVRRGHLARPARDRPAQPDDRARRRPQPARRRGRRGRARGLLRVLPADRRHRRDGGQGRRGPAGRARAAPRPRRLHPELHRPRDAGRASWPRPRAEVFGEDRVTVAPRLADAHRPGRHAGRGRGGVRRPARAPARCWSPARWSPSARPARMLAARQGAPDA